MLLNIPFIGQDFTVNYGIYNPSKKGIWRLNQLDLTNRIGEMDDGKYRERNVFLLPDGTFVDENLFPRKTYWLCVDRLIYDPDGTIKIEGIFPDYKIKDTGERVWRDHDGTFVFHPVDFKSRFVLRRKQMEFRSRTRSENKRTKNWKTDIMFDRGNSTEYIWSLYRDNILVGEGRSPSQVTCEMRAARQKRELMKKQAKRQKLTIRTKGDNTAS